jgi:hypothetical protein
VVFSSSCCSMVATSVNMHDKERVIKEERSPDCSSSATERLRLLRVSSFILRDFATII